MYLIRIKKILLAFMFIIVGAVAAYLAAIKQHVSSMKESGFKNAGLVLLQSTDVLRKYKESESVEFEKYISCKAYHNFKEVSGYRTIIERSSIENSKKDEFLYELNVLTNEYSEVIKHYKPCQK